LNEKGAVENFIPILIAVFGIVLIASVAVLNTQSPDNDLVEKDIPRFATCGAITASFQEAKAKNAGYALDMVTVPMIANGTREGAGNGAAPSEYSQTNVQVEGVDEADIVKTDGQYIYTLSKGKLVIAKAFPAEEAEIVSTTDLGEFYAEEMFFSGDKLLLFGHTYYNFKREEAKETVEKAEKAIAPEIMPPPYYSKNLAVMQLWNVSNRENPVKEKTVEIEGRYVSSRLIGGHAYFVISSYPMYGILEGNSEEVVPVYRETAGKEEKNFEPIARCGEIGYLAPINAQGFVTVGSISMDSGEVEKETVVASGYNVYASSENLYLAETQYEPIAVPAGEPIVKGLVETVVPPTEKTIVHKFSLQKGKVKYMGSGKVNGRILNQFSMDEYKGHFRIATTTRQVWNSAQKSTNNIYVLNNDLKVVGSLEGLAPGEKIYSARFVGEKGYLVTFKKTDPLFVIGLSNPTNPKVLGKLKIPGYSDYLHPIDETHLIGVGKETVEADESEWGKDFAWYQGIKIAVFDVSDVENPKEMFKVEIGDRGTDSYALHDHKAFLFDKEKELLVLPILLAKIKDKENAEKWSYGEYIFQGAYVYSLNLTDGFELKGTITHLDEANEDLIKSGYFFNSNYSVKRALFIDDVLYTISDKKIALNELTDLTSIKELVIQ